MILCNHMIKKSFCTNRGRNSVTMQRRWGEVTAPMNKRTFGCLSLFITDTFISMASSNQCQVMMHCFGRGSVFWDTMIVTQEYIYNCSLRNNNARESWLHSITYLVHIKFNLSVFLSYLIIEGINLVHSLYV